MAKTKNKISAGTVATVGVGAAAVVAAAAGAYWFYGSKDAAKHRKVARSWMLKARAEVLEAVEMAVEKAGELDKDAYMKIVAGVLKNYTKASGVTTEEMQQMTRDMQSAWQHMQKVRKSHKTKAGKKSVAKSKKKSAA